MTLQIDKNGLNKEAPTYQILSYPNVKRFETAISFYDELLILIEFEDGSETHHKINLYKDKITAY